MSSRLDEIAGDTDIPEFIEMHDAELRFPEKVIYTVHFSY
jgi:hypothetical protein